MSEDFKNISWPGWETVRLIGRGSFGAVYEIERKVFDETEKAALKVISIPQNSGDIDDMYSDGYDEESITSTFKSHLKSIVAEYSLMRKMNGCSNIVNCDDVRYIQHDDGIGWDIFIKMELLMPLTKAVSTDCSEATVIKIAKDMCVALELCKKHEIVHRDIKPQNVFLSPNGDYKLGDFGIAKTVEKTMGGTKIGTYKYMAPEVYHYQPYGHSADIYSLGLVMYWLLNERRMPFMPLPPEKLKAGVEEQARNRRLSGETLPEPVHGSKGLKRIVLKACAYDPKLRYQTATEMLRDLENRGIPAKSEQPKPTPATPLKPKAEPTRPQPPVPPEPKPAPPMPPIPQQPPVQNGWKCVCGKEYPNYVSSCVCGKSKSDGTRIIIGKHNEDRTEETSKPIEIQADAKDDIICPVCNYKQRADRKVCWKCGHKLSVGTSKVNEWQCVCGRNNPAYVSTCYCGVNKYDMSNAPTPNRPTSHKEYADGEYVPGRIYYNGDEVLFEGEKYICVAPDGVQCVWNPTQQPKHWQLIVKQPTEDWRKSEAAHRAWLKSLEEKQ